MTLKKTYEIIQVVDGRKLIKFKPYLYYYSLNEAKIVLEDIIKEQPFGDFIILEVYRP